MPIISVSVFYLSASADTVDARWLLILPHLLGGFFSLHALMRNHTPQGTIAWILGLNLLPYLTIPLYLALGAERIRRSTGERLPEEAVTRMLHPIREYLRLPGDGTLEQTLHKACNTLPCEGNDIRILCDGRETYLELADAVRMATRSILLEFFIIRNDRVGSQLRELLEERARQGLQVYVIYDEIGSHKLPRGYLKSLRAAGIHTASFNGRRFWWSSFLRINYRNHRKLVIIDSEHAYLGSLNIGLEYIRIPGKTYWRDTFVHIRGPIVAQCLLSFAEDWRRATGENISHLSHPQKPAGKIRCQLVPSGPDDVPLNNWKLLLLEMASKARRRLWLATPYFVPDATIRDALLAAALRGIDVCILVPQRGDSTMADLALLSYLPDMVAHGVRIMAYEPGFLHEKIALMDDNACAIGTANLDERSLRLNFELTLLMHSRDTAPQIEHMLQQDMQHAHPLTLHHWHHTPVYTQIAAQFCRLLSPVL